MELSAQRTLHVLVAHHVSFLYHSKADQNLLNTSSYLFCIGDISEALSSETGFPFIYVFQNATGSVAGTTRFVVVILILLIMITISSLASTSRQTFAFARDNGLPFPRWIGAVSTRPHA